MPAACSQAIGGGDARNHQPHSDSRGQHTHHVGRHEHDGGFHEEEIEHLVGQADAGHDAEFTAAFLHGR